MAKWTLLEITQDILSDMTDDLVNSIDDTEAAIQVAQIVKSTYQAMMSNRNWPHTKQLLHLYASTDDNLPTHMTIEENIKEMISIFYDKRKNGETRLLYQEVKWKDPDDFLRMINGRNSDNDTVTTVTDPSGVIILLQNNKAPTWYTSFDDNMLVFDSWDSEVEDTLQTNKTMARAYVTPTFEMSDDYIPDLPEEAFAYLIEEAKSRAQLKLHQQQDVKSEQEAGRQGRWLSRKGWRIAGGIKYPDYGRRGNRYYRDPTFKDQN